MSKNEHYRAGREAMRDDAIHYINSGLLNGYLAYDGNSAIGWCNTDKKENFLRLAKNSLLYTGNTEQTKSVVCFEIAPEYRGKGIATALLQQTCVDAKEQGYTFIEGYPKLRENFNPFDYAGPIRLFEKAGFVMTEENGKLAVMRKSLDS